MSSNLRGEELPGINANAGLEQRTALHLSLVRSLGSAGKFLFAQCYQVR